MCGGSGVEGWVCWRDRYMVEVVMCGGVGMLEGWVCGGGSDVWWRRCGEVGVWWR